MKFSIALAVSSRHARARGGMVRHAGTDVGYWRGIRAPRRRPRQALGHLAMSRSRRFLAGTFVAQRVARSPARRCRLRSQTRRSEIEGFSRDDRGLDRRANPR